MLLLYIYMCIFLFSLVIKNVFEKVNRIYKFSVFFLYNMIWLCGSMIHRLWNGVLYCEYDFTYANNIYQTIQNVV